MPPLITLCVLSLIAPPICALAQAVDDMRESNLPNSDVYPDETEWLQVAEW